MTDENIAAFVSGVPADTRADITRLLKMTQDPLIGHEVEMVLVNATKFPSWRTYLRTVIGGPEDEPTTAIGTESSGNYGHSGRLGKVGGSGPGGDPHNFAMDRLKFNALKIQYAQVNNELLGMIEHPDTPEAQAKLDELKGLVKQMYRLNADPGGDEGIGMPGGARDVVIVGAGPGGLAAAVMAGTDGLDTLFIEAAPMPGGQAKFSSRIENFPGFPCGVSGETLAKSMVQQAERVGAEGLLNTKVVSLTNDPKTNLKTLTLSNGEIITTRSVILAGGVAVKTMSFPGAESQNVIYQDPKRLTAMGAGKSVVVVGGSNGAAQAALGTAQSANHVTVLSRSPLAKGMSPSQESALRANPKISIIEGDEIANLSGNTVTTKKGVSVDAHAVGLFIGGGPNTKWLPKEITLKNGAVVTDRYRHSSMPGVFAVGDVRHDAIFRIGGAVGDGQMVERNANKFIRGIRLDDGE